MNHSLIINFDTEEALDAFVNKAVAAGMLPESSMYQHLTSSPPAIAEYYVVDDY